MRSTFSPAFLSHPTSNPSMNHAGADFWNTTRTWPPLTTSAAATFALRHYHATISCQEHYTNLLIGLPPSTPNTPSAVHTVVWVILWKLKSDHIFFGQKPSLTSHLIQSQSQSPNIGALDQKTSWCGSPLLLPISPLSLSWLLLRYDYHIPSHFRTFRLAGPYFPREKALPLGITMAAFSLTSSLCSKAVLSKRIP